MKRPLTILGIETSCDETAVSSIDGRGSLDAMSFTIGANVVHSQAQIHAHYGGVYPALAKREHAINLVPVLSHALAQAGHESLLLADPFDKNVSAALAAILTHEPDLLARVADYLPTIAPPPVDAIAVTSGPGLPPALWVGVNFAKVLAYLWKKPIIPINHMEGHVIAGLLEETAPQVLAVHPPAFPAIVLLVSGGHTELLLMKDWLAYELIGETRDDAVGEAFDKAARIIGLSYPGGPEIAAHAAVALRRAETGGETPAISLPRPMIHSDDFDFSFSGLKTAVLYAAKDHAPLSEVMRDAIAYEFQEAATEVIAEKTMRALSTYGARALIVGGGVSANKRLQEKLSDRIYTELPDVRLFLPRPALTGDNALMIAAAGYARITKGGLPAYDEAANTAITAQGTWRLAS